METVIVLHKNIPVLRTLDRYRGAMIMACNVINIKFIARIILILVQECNVIILIS